MVTNITEVSKRTKNAVLANIKRVISKHGFDETRLVVRKYFEDAKGQEKLEQEIQAREEELKELRSKK